MRHVMRILPLTAAVIVAYIIIRVCNARPEEHDLVQSRENRRRQ